MALYSLRKMTIGGGAGGGDSNFPWDLTVSQAGGVTTVNIVPGSINNFVPSNMFESILAATSNTLFVKLACNTNGRVITSVLIYINSQPAINQVPVNSSLPSYFEHSVGVIYLGAGYNLARKLLTATGSRVFVTDPDTPAPPGQMAFVEWLVWAIS